MEQPHQEAFLAKLKDYQDRLLQLAKEALASEADITLGYERLRRWLDKVGSLLEEYLGPQEREELFKKKGALALGDRRGNFVRQVEAKAAFLHALWEAVMDDPSLLGRKRPGPAAETRVAVPVQTGNRRVFIVHGHDELNLHRLEKILSGLGLQPVVLRYVPGKGRTLIEKFEEEAETCTYAFVLITPDDAVWPSAGTTRDKGNYLQSRPNVIFELGWLYGRLGRNRVCILFHVGTRLHSDLDGISRVQFTENVEHSALDIQRELRAAGLIQ